LSEPVAQIAAADPSLREELAALLARSNDLAVARRLGIRVRSTHAPHHVLSPRELEVIELLARGFRNKDVANALVISESTTKVHVRHILEKLGVRTRAEAVARYQLYSD
jgi:DNA-binding NarL/FixJ family response regulator